MHRIAATLGLLLSCAVAGFPQTTPETVQVGYAIVTPSFPISTGMSVFETVTQSRAQDTLEAAAIPANLMMTALIPIDVSATESRNVGIAVVNPNSALVTVAMTLRRSDGTTFTTGTLTISSRRQIAKLVTELFPSAPSGGISTQAGIPAEFSGTLLLTSTGPISVIGFRLRGNNFSTLPATDLSQTINPIPAIATGVGGLGAVLLPQFVTGAGWATELEIANTTGSSLTVRLDVFTPEGAPMSVKLNGVTASSFTNLVVPANGLFRILPN
jgi:hypothetical protein